MPPNASGTLTIDQGVGPFHYGQTLTFTTTTDHLQGGHPMVEVALFQDVGGIHGDTFGPPPDGVITRGLFAGDLVGLALNVPAQPVPLPPGGETDTSIPALGWVRLLSYDTKGKQETITELARVDFDVEP